jgi:hypothetical protein
MPCARTLLPLPYTNSISISYRGVFCSRFKKGHVKEEGKKRIKARYEGKG